MFGSEVIGDKILIRDAHLCAARANQRIGTVRRRLLNLNLKAVVFEETLFLCNVDAGMVCVRRVIQHKRNLGMLGRIVLLAHWSLWLLRRTSRSNKPGCREAHRAQKVFARKSPGAKTTIHVIPLSLYFCSVCPMA